MNKDCKGFTLIELLVVISIISLLSSVVLASLNGARQKARTMERVSDMKQIATALEMYYDEHGSYPNPGWGWRGECAGFGGLTPDNVIPGLTPHYMHRFPSDPSMNKAANQSCYLYLSNGTDYAVLDHAVVDPGFSYLSHPTFEDPLRDGGTNGCIIDGTGFWSWKISSPGGKCW